MSSKIRALMALALAAPAIPAAAQALPSGGRIVQGAGSVAVNGAQMVVTQDSARLVADWHSFSIGAANAVRFVQPSADAVALNRVTGSDPSAIFGSLGANGHVYLQNPNGVLFAPGAQVSVGSLVATSLDVDLPAFMAGRLQLSGDGTRGAVRNDGSLVTTAGGHVVLVAPQVANTGSIATPGGTTALVAGSAVNVDPTGAGLLSISVPAAAVNARLEQAGTITADGGAVRLAAAAADAALGTVMQVGGVVRARSIEQRGGEIVLSGGGSGVVRLSGTLDASGGAAASGGSVKVLGERVALVGDARIDASGAHGGGTVLVGGNYQGRGPEQNARDTYVGARAVIDASATRHGDGGTVVVWSDGATSYAGRTLARGGAEGGNGGRVEVSGKGTLGFAGEVDLRAPAGRAGELLLDPADLEIGTVADLNNDGTPGDDLVGPDMLFDGNTAPSYITAARVAQLLGTGNVTLQAADSISLTAPLTVAPGGAASTLTLNSARITLSAPMTLENASLVADTGAPGLPFDSIAVVDDISSLASISLTSQEIFLDGNLSAQNVALTTRPPMGGSISTQISQDSSTGITAGTLTLASLPGSVTMIDLPGVNRVGSLVFSNAIYSAVNVDNPVGTPLALSGSVDSLILTSASGIVQGAPLTVANIFDLSTTDAGAATGAVDLSNGGNTFGGNVSFNVASHFALAASGALGVNGSAGGDLTVRAGGVLSLSGTLESTGAFGASRVELAGAGIQDGVGQIVVPTGGRMLLRSSDYTNDSLSIVSSFLDYVVYGSGTIDPGAGNGFYTNRTATIAPNPDDAPPISRVYDGTTAFAYTQAGSGGTLSEAGVGGQSHSVFSYTLHSTGAFADKNVGTGKAYTIAPSNDVTADTGGIVRYGASYAGFSRPAGPAGSPGHATSEVTPLGITSTGLTGVDRVYDGLTTVAVNAAGAVLGGVLAGDAVTLDTSGAVGAMSDRNAGANKAIGITGLALGGADGGNYVVTDASNAVVTITPRTLTSTGLLAIDRVYDGTTTVAADVSGAVLGGPVVTGDAVSIAGASGTMADKHVGTGKPVILGTVTLAGADAGNYTVVDASAATVDITPRTVAASGINGLDRVYDGTLVVGVDASGATLLNAVAGDDVVLDTSAAGGLMADKNAGTGKAVTIAGVTLAGADAGNYSFAGLGSSTVDIAALQLTPVGIGAVDRVADGSTGVTLETANAGLLGVLPGDVVGLDASGASGSVASPAAGLQPVSVSGLVLTGPDAANYSLAATALSPRGVPLAVRLMTPAQAAFESVRYRQYLQGVSDAQEPFRRAMAEALAAGFGKENIRKQLTRGLVFETGLAAPAVDDIDSAARPEPCAGAGTDGASLACGR